MNKPEWGIYPENFTPKLFWGARGIIKKGQLDLPPDRQSFLAEDEERKEKFVNYTSSQSLVMNSMLGSMSSPEVPSSTRTAFLSYALILPSNAL